MRTDGPVGIAQPVPGIAIMSRDCTFLSPVPMGNGSKKELTGCSRLEEKTASGREPEYDLAARFSSIEIALGEEDPDR